uniref:Uncharacterized protein n=1 Tax=Arundo donax TaxID=35708 RepID=A0A0A9GM76_ARUDO
MVALVSSHPMSDPEDDLVQEIAGMIRLTFRIVTASLEVKLEYEGRPASSKQGVKDL